MNTMNITFRGTPARVFIGPKAPVKKRGHYYYGIRSHQTENMPLSIEKLVFLNRWGTIETTEPIIFDEKNADQEKYDRTSLTLNEVMSLVGYSQVG